MIDFIKQNWQYIILFISTLSVLFNIVLLIIKRVPISKILKVISLVPSLINQAEALFPVPKYGASKREFVKSLFDDLLVKYHLEKYAKYINIDEIIEDYLSCPEKKEIL